MSIFESNNTNSIMKNITPDPSKNSFTEKISKTISRKPTVTDKLASNFSGIKSSISQTFSPIESPTDNGVNIIKILLIVLIIAFLTYNIYLYFYEGTDIFQKYFGIVLFKTGQGEQIMFFIIHPKVPKKLLM